MRDVRVAPNNITDTISSSSSSDREECDLEYPPQKLQNPRWIKMINPVFSSKTTTQTEYQIFKSRLPLFQSFKHADRPKKVLCSTIVIL